MAESDVDSLLSQHCRLGLWGLGDGHGPHRAGVGDALLQRRRVLLLLHKSDHGSQYVATACQQRLTAWYSLLRDTQNRIGLCASVSDSPGR